MGNDAEKFGKIYQSTRRINRQGYSLEDGASRVLREDGELVSVSTVPRLRKHILILTAVRVSLYGIYLKCLGNLERWDPHTRTSKILSVQPPHLPDLNVSDSYLWGHLKPLGYSDPIEKEETLQQHILMHVKKFPTAQRTFEITRKSIIRLSMRALIQAEENLNILCEL